MTGEERECVIKPRMLLSKQRAWFEVLVLFQMKGRICPLVGLF